jgi:hypothetical protein
MESTNDPGAYGTLSPMQPQRIGIQPRKFSEPIARRFISAVRERSGLPVLPNLRRGRLKLQNFAKSALCPLLIAVGTHKVAT